MEDSSEPQGVGKLAAKIAKVMAAIDEVPKNGWNNFHNYEYSTDDDVMQKLRPAMAEVNLIALPSVKSREVKRVSTGKKESDYQLHTRVTLEITLVDGDSGQSTAVTWEGEAQDGQDKGLYKAYTSGIKYWALKTFLLSADSDVETHDAAANQSAGRPSNASAKRGNSGGNQDPTEKQLEYAADLYGKDCWSEAEQKQLRDRVSSANKNELSDLIDQMKETIEQRQNGS